MRAGPLKAAALKLVLFQDLSFYIFHFITPFIFVLSSNLISVSTTSSTVALFGNFGYPNTVLACPGLSPKTFLNKSDAPFKPTIFSSFLSNDGRQAPQNPTPSHSPDFEKTPPSEHAAPRIGSVACDALPRFPA